MRTKILLAVVASALLTALALSIVSGSPNSQQSSSDDSIETLIAVIRDAYEKGALSDTSVNLLSDWFIESLIVHRTGETPAEVRARFSSQLTPTVIPTKETIVFSDPNWASVKVQNRIAQYIIVSPRRAHQLHPPSTGNATPVTHFASSLAR